MSDEEIKLESGKHILNVVYHHLENSVPVEESYRGEYNDITLKKFCTTAVTHSAIVNLTNEAKDACSKAKNASEEAAKASSKAKDASHRTLSIIITIITVMLAILTILMTATTVFLSFQALNSSINNQVSQTSQVIQQEVPSTNSNGNNN